MCKIAVLDDDELWSLSIQLFFRNTFEVDTYSDANSLLEQLVNDIKQYDLIMIDLSLPHRNYKEVDGRKIIRYLRKIMPAPPLLVLVTAFIGRNELDSGEITCEEADAFIAKDAGLDEILRRVQMLLNSKKNCHSTVKVTREARW